MANLQRLEEFSRNAGRVQFPAPSEKKPVDYAARFMQQRNLSRLNAFLAEGKIRVNAPNRDATRDNYALQFAESVGATVTHQARKEATIPPRAVAFDKLPVKEAMQRFPELEGAYRMLAQAKRVGDRLPSEDARQGFLETARKRISAELHQGKVVEAPAQEKDRSR